MPSVLDSNILIYHLNGVLNDELEEFLADVLDELLQVAPDWFMAQNLAGVVKHKTRPEEAREHYEKVVFLRPDHYVGYYNLACSYARPNEFDKAIEYLETIVNRDGLTESYRMHEENMENETDFDELKRSEKHAKRFAEIVRILNAGRGA